MNGGRRPEQRSYVTHTGAQPTCRKTCDAASLAAPVDVHLREVARQSAAPNITNIYWPHITAPSHLGWSRRNLALCCVVAHSLQNHDHKLTAQPRSFTGPPCPQFQPVTTLVLAHCLERSSLCSSRCMLHFLLLPLPLSACYAPGVTRARIACLVCLQAHHYCTCHHIPRPQLLGGCLVIFACASNTAAKNTAAARAILHP